ncbi:protein Abitram-like [Styela clava]
MDTTEVSENASKVERNVQILENKNKMSECASPSQGKVSKETHDGQNMGVVDTELEIKTDKNNLSPDKNDSLISFANDKEDKREDTVIAVNKVQNDSDLEESPFPSVVDRYFTRLYKVNLPSGTLNYEDFKTTRNDVRILWHSNKICLVTLAPSHPAFSPDKTISEVSFKVTLKCDRSNNKVSGKRKRGAQWLNPESPLCIVTLSDGEKYTVHSGIRGNLIEVNENLLKYPELLKEKPETNGYIAVVMIKLQERERLTNNLLSESQYEEYLKKIKNEL